MDKILHFSKYQGAGNHFIFVNNISNKYPFLTDNQALIHRLCDVNFGIGGNGLIELLPCPGYDYYMNFYGKDGSRGNIMCGNGSRCAAILAYEENIISIKKEIHFRAFDGPHMARIINENPVEGLVEVQMKDVDELKMLNDSDYFVDIGIPHYVRFVQGVSSYPLVEQGHVIQNMPECQEVGGAVVDFTEWSEDVDDMGKRWLHLRTYEWRNQAEIQACGTGAVAGALVAYWKGWKDTQNQRLSEQSVQSHYSSRTDTSLTTDVVMPGGTLMVSFQVDEKCRFTNVWLRGPAKKVFSGQLKVE